MCKKYTKFDLKNLPYPMTKYVFCPISATVKFHLTFNLLRIYCPYHRYVYIFINFKAV